MNQIDRYRNYAEQIFSCTPNGLLVMDAGYRLRSVNPVMRRILGLSAGEPVTASYCQPSSMSRRYISRRKRLSLPVCRIKV